MSWFGGLKAKVLVNEALAKHTTLKSGPGAGLWIEPFDKEDLRALIKRCRSLKKIILSWAQAPKCFLKKEGAFGYTSGLG